MLLVPVLIWVLFGVAAAIVAAHKKRSGFGWFLLGILLGPFGLLFVLLLPSRQSQLPPASPAPAVDFSNTTKQCPQCAETIKLEAKKCRFCGAVFDAAAVDSEMAARHAELEAHLAAGHRQCPHCGGWEVLPRASLPDGGFGPWCPHCRRPA